MAYNSFPYVNMHELNLDYLLNKSKEVQTNVEAAAGSASAAASSAAAAAGSADASLTYSRNSANSAAASEASAADSAESARIAAAAAGDPVTFTAASQLTNTSKIYVYIGETGTYTYGHWYYYAGGAWIDGGVYGMWTTDDALDPDSTDAVQNKVIYNAVNNLHSDLNENMNMVFTDLYEVGEGRTVTWYQGGLTNSGVSIDATNRIRTTYVQTHKPYQIDVPSGYKVRIAHYTRDSGGAHFAFWDDWQYESFDLYADYEYDWRAMMGRVDDADVVPADGANIIFYPIDPIDYATKDYVNDRIYIDFPVSFTNNDNHYWNIETDQAVLTEISAQFYASDPIPVEEGDTFTLTARQGTTDKARIWVITDDSYNIISMCENFNGTELHTVTFTVPANGTKLLLTKQQTSSEQTLLKKLSALDMITSPLKGKKLSLLGDSISALAGTIPEGNAAYYTGSNRGITSASQMWWSVLCANTGMVPCIIDGWNGSGINWQTDTGHLDIVPMSSDLRCGRLHNGSETPDVILIAGGLNDYTYAEAAQNEPLSWDGKSAPGYTDQAGKQVYNSFTDAYVAMIKKLQTNYPKAIIVALSTWFSMRGTDNGYTLTHTVGNNVWTQQDYNDKIRYVAEQMHIPYIDVSNIGFNRNNFYPTYASDNATIPTHPNAAGHAVMGKAVAAKMLDMIKGFM